MGKKTRYGLPVGSLVGLEGCGSLCFSAPELLCLAGAELGVQFVLNSVSISPAASLQALKGHS